MIPVLRRFAKARFWSKRSWSWEGINLLTLVRNDLLRSAVNLRCILERDSPGVFMVAFDLLSHLDWRIC